MMKFPSVYLCRFRRWSGGLLAAVGTLSIVLAASLASASSAVPVPEVSVPPTGTHGFPFDASAMDLSKYGYVEQEFLISGTAHSYVAANTFGSDGKWDTTPSDTVGVYKVRLLVRRPSDPSRFNGTVVVEWLNVTGIVDRTPEWAFMHDELLREGYAYVGVTAQYLGALSLHGWETGDGARYQDVTHPGDSFSYDIFSQAGMAIRNPRTDGPKPLGDLTPRIRAMVAVGQSQSGDRLFTYANAFQRQAQVYDGLIIHSTFGSAPVSQASAASFPTIGTIPLQPGMPVTPDVTTPQPAQIRNDLNQPVMVISTETELNTPDIAQGIHQQPDSRMIRIWEVAGAAHADVDSLASMNADLAKSDATLPQIDCGDLPTNDGKVNGQVTRAAVAAMQNWLRTGIAPPIGPRLKIDIAGDTVTIERDPATGLALGGIRLPDVVVPTETLTGVRPAGAGGPFCFLFGGGDHWNGDSDSYDGLSYDPSPTPEPLLSTLYPTQSDYVMKVFSSGVLSLFSGFLRPADFLSTVAAATQKSLSP